MTRSAQIRGLLAAGPSTCQDIAEGLRITKEQTFGAVESLCQLGHVVKTGRVIETKGKTLKIYELTPRGRALARREAGA
jgi:predicted ArsR family transcriptional regulator